MNEFIKHYSGILGTLLTVLYIFNNEISTLILAIYFLLSQQIKDSNETK